MEESRIEQAIQRIEAALNRVEAVSGKLAQNSGNDSDLQQRHQVMRSQVSATLQDLDNLIKGLEG